MKVSIIFSLILISCASAVAQNNPKPNTTQTPPVTYGARGKFGIADAQLFDNYLKAIEGVGTSSKELLAEQSLKSYMMPPRKMGAAANADCYAIMSAMEFTSISTAIIRTISHQILSDSTSLKALSKKI